VTLVRFVSGERDDEAGGGQGDAACGQQRPVWKIGNDIVTGMYSESLRFPEVPANLYDRPTLLMSLENEGGRKQQVETSYLATNLAWNSDYVLTIGRDDKAADLDGWVTLTNKQRHGVHNARLQLVAGDLNRIQNAPAAAGMAMDMAVSRARRRKICSRKLQRISLVFAGTKDFR